MSVYRGVRGMIEIILLFTGHLRGKLKLSSLLGHERVNDGTHYRVFNLIWSGTGCRVTSFAHSSVLRPLHLRSAVCNDSLR